MLKLTGQAISHQGCQRTAEQDTITITGGNDFLFTLGGANTLAFTSAAASQRVVADRTAGKDKIALSKTGVFILLTTTLLGVMEDGDFLSVANAAALADDSVAASTHGQAIIYLQDTGALYYNTNGATAGGLVLIATLVGSPDGLAEGDFTVTV